MSLKISRQLHKSKLRRYVSYAGFLSFEGRKSVGGDDDGEDRGSTSEGRSTMTGEHVWQRVLLTGARATSPYYVEKLFLHYQGFERIEEKALDQFTQVREVWLAGNSLTTLKPCKRKLSQVRMKAKPIAMAESSGLATAGQVTRHALHFLKFRKKRAGSNVRKTTVATGSTFPQSPRCGDRRGSGSVLVAGNGKTEPLSPCSDASSLAGSPRQGRRLQQRGNDSSPRDTLRRTRTGGAHISTARRSRGGGSTTAEGPFAHCGNIQHLYLNGNGLAGSVVYFEGGGGETVAQGDGEPSDKDDVTMMRRGGEMSEEDEEDDCTAGMGQRGWDTDSGTGGAGETTTDDDDDHNGDSGRGAADGPSRRCPRRDFVGAGTIRNNGGDGLCHNECDHHGKETQPRRRRRRRAVVSVCAPRVAVNPFTPLRHTLVTLDLSFNALTTIEGIHVLGGTLRTLNLRGNLLSTVDCPRQAQNTPTPDTRRDDGGFAHHADFATPAQEQATNSPGGSGHGGSDLRLLVHFGALSHLDLSENVIPTVEGDTLVSQVLPHLRALTHLFLRDNPFSRRDPGPHPPATQQRSLRPPSPQEQQPPPVNLDDRNMGTGTAAAGTTTGGLPSPKSGVFRTSSDDEGKQHEQWCRDGGGAAAVLTPLNTTNKGEEKKKEEEEDFDTSVFVLEQPESKDQQPQPSLGNIETSPSGKTLEKKNYYETILSGTYSNYTHDTEMAAAIASSSRSSLFLSLPGSASITPLAPASTPTTTTASPPPLTLSTSTFAAAVATNTTSTRSRSTYFSSSSQDVYNKNDMSTACVHRDNPYCDYDYRWRIIGLLEGLQYLDGRLVLGYERRHGRKKLDDGGRVEDDDEDDYDSLSFFSSSPGPLSLQQPSSLFSATGFPTATVSSSAVGGSLCAVRHKHSQQQRWTSTTDSRMTNDFTLVMSEDSRKRRQWLSDCKGFIKRYRDISKIQRSCLRQYNSDEEDNDFE